MVKCAFSGKEIPPGRGIMFVKRDGKVLHFLNRKCKKNMIDLGRKARETTWTQEYAAVKAATKATKK